MKHIEKLNNWSILQCERSGSPGNVDIESATNSGFDWIDIGAPDEVQAVLMRNGLLADTVLEDGEAEYCAWVAEADWVYRCRFAKPVGDRKTQLHFAGLDTVADIYLNGTWIAGNKTMYLPLRLDVTGSLMDENELLLYFHSPYKMLEIYEETMPEEWKGIVKPSAMLRKSGGDFGVYLGVVPQFTPIGIFGDVCLEMPDETEITASDMDTTFNFDYSEASMVLHAEGEGFQPDTEVEFILCEENGPAVFQSRCSPTESDEGKWSAKCDGSIPNPRLWWPKNYGGQPLYEMKVSVYVKGALRDEKVRLTGLREVRLAGSLKFVVNGTVVKLWGSNIGPIGGLTHRWDPAPAVKLIEMADECNMNALRLWGPSKIYGEELYLEADRRGIMLWQDFFTGSSQLPNNEEYKAIFLSEAENLVRRLKHHPSIFVWCGGNENIYMTEYSEETARIGHEILTHDFRTLSARLDPYRYYHDTCPTEGMFTNDPKVGDTHGNRAFLAFLPGEQNANFFSEDIRTSPPGLRSFKRFMKDEDLWPEGYSDIHSFGVDKPYPEPWKRRTTNFSERKFGPIEQFYDATDADSLVYKFAAAAGHSYHETITNCRQGKPMGASDGDRNCNGYMFWKLNNTWPSFYCGIIDYYMETHIPYFCVKRAFEPFLLTIDVKDHICIWGVNDTIMDMSGQLEIKLFRLSKGKVVTERSMCAAVPAGESRVLANLDSLGAVWKDTVILATLTDSEGVTKGRAVGFVDIERHMPFPDAVLELSCEDGYVVVETDAFARCIELSGNEDGDEFGWVFEDNYFDLLPFERKYVRVSGRHDTGKITAKAHYSSQETQIGFRRDTV